MDWNLGQVLHHCEFQSLSKASYDFSSNNPKYTSIFRFQTLNCWEWRTHSSGRQHVGCVHSFLSVPVLTSGFPANDPCGESEFLLQGSALVARSHVAQCNLWHGAILAKENLMFGDWCDGLKAKVNVFLFPASHNAECFPSTPDTRPLFRDKQANCSSLHLSLPALGCWETCRWRGRCRDLCVVSADMNQRGFYFYCSDRLNSRY